MDRVWLLTWTTYGTWLPGDDRGYVSNVRDGTGPEIKHNEPNTAFDAKDRGLLLSAKKLMKGEAIRLNQQHAHELALQFEETAAHRAYSLLAYAIMRNHVHIVVGVPDDLNPELVLKDFKSYGSRRLNHKFGKTTSETWWTVSGSKRKLPDDTAAQAAVNYVANQEYVLVVWVNQKSENEQQDKRKKKNPGINIPGSPEVTRNHTIGDEQTHHDHEIDK